jgi:hypothetical protein
MSKRPISERELTIERELTMKLLELENKKQFKAARTILREKLDSGASLTKRRQEMLLDNLIRVELRAGRPLAALKAFERRRTLGTSSLSERLYQHLEAATILSQSEQWLAARAELTQLFTDKHFLQSSELLSALERYFDIEDECRKLLTPILEDACKTAVRRLGIPLSIDLEKATLEETVRSARTVYRAAAQKYQALLLRAFADTDQDQRNVLELDLKEYISDEKVGFFNGLARELLARLTTQNEEGRRTRRRTRQR